MEMRDSPYTLLNLEHPAPVKWSSIFVPAARILDVMLLPYAQWLSKLAATDPHHESSISQTSSEGEVALSVDSEKNPALKIIDFFRVIHDKEEDVDASTAGDLPGAPLKRRVKRLALANALAVSPSLRRECATPLSVRDVESWLKGWDLISVS